MANEYEQLQLDTREELEKAVFDLTINTIVEIKHMIAECGSTRNPVRTRHEAYGVAAQHQDKIHSHNKSIKRKMEGLLATLEYPAYDAALKADVVAQAMVKMAQDSLMAAAEVGRTAKDLLQEGVEDDGE